MEIEDESHAQKFRRRNTPANIYLFKAAIEVLEKGVKYVQSYQKKHLKDVID